MGKTIVVLLIGLTLASVHLTEAQQSKKVAYSGLLSNDGPSLISPLADVFVRTTLSAVPAHAQEEVSSSTAQNLAQPQILKVSLKGAGMFGSDLAMVTHLYKPQGDGPFPVVVFSHGRGPEISDRLNLKYPVSVGHGNFWLRKGFAVVAPVRPGYGESEGMDHEDAGSKWRRGQCIGEPDFFYLTNVAGEAVLATLDWVRAQPWANKEKILLVGVSVGGLTSAAIAAKGPPGLVGYINFSGGDSQTKMSAMVIAAWDSLTKGILSARVFIAGREAKARGFEPKLFICSLTAYLFTARPDLSNSVSSPMFTGA